MVKTKTILMLGSILAMLSIEGYAKGGGSPILVKPEVQRVVYYGGKWTMVYNDINTSTGYVSERVIVDGFLDREVPVGNHETRSFSFVGGPYDTESCHQVVIEVLDGSNHVATTSDVFHFGDTTDCANIIGKPVIHSIEFSDNKWQILYKDVAIASNLEKEILFIDGEIDRIVTAGVNGSADRGFNLTRSDYDVSTCHSAYIVTYDKDHNIVTTSDTFYFGDTSGGCSIQTDPDITPPNITLAGVTPQIIKVGDAYEELGATAFDNRDGDITVNIVTDASAVDISTAGYYIVTYTVSDAVGNVTTETRTVRVVSPSNVEKPMIHRVVFDSRQNKWFIVYKDVQISSMLTTEEVYIDGISDRIVAAGINSYNDRVFALTGTYDTNSCHAATIVVHGANNTDVIQSDVFPFGTCP